MATKHRKYLPQAMWDCLDASKLKVGRWTHTFHIEGALLDAGFGQEQVDQFVARELIPMPRDNRD